MKFQEKKKSFKFVSLAKEGVDLDDEKDTNEQNLEDLCKYIKTILGNKIEKVVRSSRLDKFPCIIVTGKFGNTARMEQIINSQAVKNNGMNDFMKARKTLEINPDHNIIKKMESMRQNENDGSNKKMLADLVTLMYDCSLVLSGFSLDKPSNFVEKINKIIESGLSVTDDYDNDNNGNAEEENFSNMPELEDTANEQLVTPMEQVD